MFNAIVCRYHEIAIKGNNRNFFERVLVENLHWLLREYAPLKISRIRGRIWLEKADRADFTPEELQGIGRELALRAFGVESFSPAVLTPPDMEQLRAALTAHADAVFRPALEAAGPTGKVTFRVRSRRSDKTFPFRSKEIEIDFATRLGERYGDDRLEIDLDNGAITVYVEVREELALLFFERIAGPGGLPVGSNARVLALLSGGIDSPVACYLTMKRGSPVDYVGFHSAPYTPPETEEKVRGIAAYLNGFQRKGHLFFGNLAELQKLIRDRCNPRFRTILYRRMMFRIAEKIAEANHDLALLTGESLGQVASQTVSNMATIDRAVHSLVLRPLCGQDKNETIRIAEKIGTFPLSNVQVPDSCTVFSPSSPATASLPEQLEEEEAKIPEYPAMIEQIVADALAREREEFSQKNAD